jgi:hypothetical protein
MKHIRVLPNISTLEATKAAFKDIKADKSNQRFGIGSHAHLCAVDRTLRTFNQYEKLTNQNV